MNCSEANHIFIAGGSSSAKELPPNTLCQCGKYQYREFTEFNAINKRLKIENARLRAALVAEHQILMSVITSPKSSIGSIDNVYLPQLDREHVDYAFELGKWALK